MNDWTRQTKLEQLIDFFSRFRFSHNIFFRYIHTFIHYITIINWMTTSSEFEFFFHFFFFLLSVSNSWIVWKNDYIHHASNNRDRIEYFSFRNFFDILFYHIIIFNVQLNRTTISENVFDTIQFFMRRKL